MQTQSNAENTSAVALPTDVITIVGAGQAACVVARTLRGGGHRGPIRMIGEEPHLPYERPPLSKAVLLGQATVESTYLATADQLLAQDIAWIHGQATAIDRDDRHVHLSDGRSLPYDRLVLATGGRARSLPLPGAGLAGIVSLRTLEDAAVIAAQLHAAGPIVIVGGGWIGLEVAASARKTGADVTVVEALPMLCARSLPPCVADHLLVLHRAAGVTVRLNCGVRGFVGQDSVRAVELDDGQVLPADLVVVGVGMIPNSDIARDAGLAVASGILVDEDGRTSDPLIFAAGDVTETQTVAGLVRVESWANANEQGAGVAAALLGHRRAAHPPAWFWSDQYDANIQMLGRFSPGTESIVLGAPEDGAATWLYLADGGIAAAIAINRPRDIQAARRLIQRGLSVTPEAITRVGGDLSLLLRQAAA